MEEKERYEYYPKQNQLYDKINDELYCLGIKQDKTRLVDFLNLMNEDWWTLYERNKELREENQQLKQQLHDLPNKIVGEIKLQLFNHFKVKNIEQYENLPLIDSLFTADTVIEILDTILEKFGGKDE